jgi:hypothetical protein
MDEKHTHGRQADNASEAKLVALVEKLRQEHAARTPKEGWRLHSSALRRWARERRGELLPTVVHREQLTTPSAAL